MNSLAINIDFSIYNLRVQYILAGHSLSQYDRFISNRFDRTNCFAYVIPKYTIKVENRIKFTWPKDQIMF